MSFFSVRNLCVRLDGFALRDVSFEIEEAAYLSVLGPSGTGKSVLLNSIAGFHDVESGEIRLGGENITPMPPERRGIGIVYQDYALFPHLTVFGNIAYGLRVRERDAAVVRRRVEDIAGELGLQSVMDKRPKLLSGGERQRVALARALVVRPRLLMLDEPFAALDPSMRHDFRRLIRTVVGEFGITVIHVAHDLDDMWALADRVLILENGQVNAFDKVNSVLGPPAPNFLRRVEGVCVIIGTITARENGMSLVESDGACLATSNPAEVGEIVRLVIRPEDVTLYTEKPAGASARNILQSSVTGIHFNGDTALVSLRCERMEFNALLTRNAVENLSLASEKEIFATIKAVHLNTI